MNHDEIMLNLIRKDIQKNASAASINESVFFGLFKLRTDKLTKRLVDAFGTKTVGGPFQGLDLSAEGASLPRPPKLLGVYEMEMHGFVNEIIKQPYEVILNIGCAEGYYAVGFALKMPHTQVYAHDILEKEQIACRALAKRNGVQDRVHVGGVVEGKDFANYADKRTLVFCDIEGAERELLNPTLYPTLKNMDVIVECHECFVTGLRAELIARFQDTHTIRWAEPERRWGKVHLNVPDLDDLDMCLLTYENRGGPTPWGYMRRKAG